MVELLLKLRHRRPVIAEVPSVLQYDRKQGASKIRLARTLRQYVVATGPRPARAGPLPGAVNNGQTPRPSRLGTRPEAVKMAPLAAALRAAGVFEPVVVATDSTRRWSPGSRRLRRDPGHSALGWTAAPAPSRSSCLA